MKGVYISVGIALLLIVLVYFVFSKKGSSKPESIEDDLTKIKEKIREVEGYREYYRSDGNNGLTVGGTILEQGIDVLVEILKQPLVKELSQKIIQNKEDAIFIAEQIEIMGKELVSLLKDNQILRCGSNLIRKCEDIDSPEDAPVKEEVMEDGSVIVASKGTICSYVEDETEPPTENCEIYRPNYDNIKYIMDQMQEKGVSIMNDDTKRSSLYTAFKNVMFDNQKQIYKSSGRGKDFENSMDGFPTEEEFFTQMNSLNRKVKLPAAKSVVEEETA